MVAAAGLQHVNSQLGLPFAVFEHINRYWRYTVSADAGRRGALSAGPPLCGVSVSATVRSRPSRLARRWRPAGGAGGQRCRPPPAGHGRVTIADAATRRPGRVEAWINCSLMPTVDGSISCSRRHFLYWERIPSATSLSRRCKTGKFLHHRANHAWGEPSQLSLSPLPQLRRRRGRIRSRRPPPTT